jgi:gliding motility-associated-like protein
LKTHVAILFLKNKVLALIFLMSGSLYAQVEIEPGDSTICFGDTIELEAKVDSILGTTVYTFASTTYNPQPIAGTVVSGYISNTPGSCGSPAGALDDGVAGPFNIGFNFCFMGNTYTQFYVGTNGWISFTANQPSTYFTTTLPNTNACVPKNCIMGPWQDWDLTTGGQILYQTTGTSPNRKCVISFDNVPLFSCASAKGTFQIVLNEGSNLIENFIPIKPSCGWNGNQATQGIHNLNGTLAYTVPGRNSTPWTATNEGWQFIPGGPAGYTVTWYKNGVQVAINTDEIDVSPTDTAEYIAKVVYNCSGVAYYDTVTINVTSLPVFSTYSNNVACNGENNGSTGVNGLSGFSPFTYQWNTSPLQTSTFIDSLFAGNYTVFVTDSLGCMDSSTISITEPSPISTSAVLTNALCAGDTNGNIIVTVSGGISPYSYLWNNGQTGNPATNLSAGNYYLTVTDDSNCIFLDTFIITEPLPLQVNLNVTNVGCNGGINGAIFAGVFGGTTPYSYVWSNGFGGNQIFNLGAGYYSVTVTDVNGCQAIAGDTVKEPPVLVMNITKHDISCFGLSDGSAISSPTGGAPPYSYTWSNGQATDSIGGLGIGSYLVTVTDNNGCLKFGNVFIQQPSPLIVTVIVTNTSCNGSSTGSITANPFGGTSPYSYLWSDGQTGKTATGLPAGSYTVTVTDTNGCTKTASGTVTQPAAMTIGFSGVQVLCNGAQTGSINSNISGGSSPYGYAWGNGATTSGISGLVVGTYVLTVTDNGGCIKVDSFTITGPPAILHSLTTTNLLCNGQNTGSITLTASGGSGSLQYLWSNGPTTANQSNLGAGTYIVTITDGNGCKAYDTATITQPSTLVLSLNSTSAICTAGNGSATANGSGGTGTISYLWDNGSTTPGLNNVAGGQYTVTITDQNGCTKTDSVTVSINPGTLQASLTMTPENCVALDGTATVTVSGGTSPITYQWGNGQSTSGITGLSSGQYSVTVTDSNGCTVTDSIMVTNDPGTLGITLSSTAEVCIGQNGTATVTATGGTPGYTYQWNTGQTTPGLTGLSSGVYQVTVTDQNGCAQTDSVTVANDPGSLSATNGVQNVACNGQSNGQAWASGSGGQMPYSYVWGNGQTGDTLKNVTAGSYQYTVTDSNGCYVNATVNITEPTAIQSTVSSIGASCNGGNNGSAQASASGGSPGYGYVWNTGQTTQAITNQVAGTYYVTITDSKNCQVTDTAIIIEPAAMAIMTVSLGASCAGAADGKGWATVNGGTGPYGYQWDNGQTTDTVKNVQAGTYKITVTDSKGCTAVDSVAITAPQGIVIAFTVNPVSCNGGNDGQISTNITGGTSPYNYNWSSGHSTAGITAQPAGAYSVTVTDQNGCQSVDSATIQEPVKITLSISTTPEQCVAKDGSAAITATGGTPPFSYAWNTGQSTQTIGNIASGAYTVTVTDGKGCTADTTAIVANDPGNLKALITAKRDISCNGGNDGMARAQGQNGQSPYSYQWNTGSVVDSVSGATAGWYYFTVTDQSGCYVPDSVQLSQPQPLQSNLTITHIDCQGNTFGTITTTPTGGTAPYNNNWSNGATGSTITNLSTGTYYLTITDAKNCKLIDTVNILRPSQINISLTGQNLKCFQSNDGSITTVVSGGIPPYGYSWSNGAITAGQGNLPAGTYYLALTDAGGCREYDTITITQPQAVQYQKLWSDVSCNGAKDGYVKLGQVTGGTAPYSYQWSTGQQSDSVGQLGPGTYYVTLTDANQCSTTDSITIGGPTAITIQLATTAISCNGGSDGSISTTVTGGTSPYTFNWSSGQATQNIQNLQSGAYTITVTDSKGCAQTASDMLNDPMAIQTTVVKTDIACNGGNTGTASVTATGGTPPYNYIWTTGATTSGINNLGIGQYKVTVTDNKGCQKTDSVIIQQQSGMTVGITSTGVSCFGGNDGTATATVSGGNPPYGYLWSTGGTTATIGQLAAGNYLLTVTDNTGCKAIQSVTVSGPTKITITLTVANISCYGKQDGSITTSVQGGAGNYTYAWDNGQATSNINALSAGPYGLTVTDAKGCTAGTSATVTQPAEITITGTATGITCNGDEDGRISAQAQNGSPPYQYQWPGGPVGQQIAGLRPGNYILTVTDGKGCTKTKGFTVAGAQPINVDAGAAIAISSGSTAQLNATVQPTGNYTYSWQPPATLDNPQQKSPVASPSSTTIYTVTATNANGCNGSDTVRVNVYEKFNAWVPNAFTPNGDGKNDVFRVETGAYTSFRLRIFNRWGEMVFESQSHGQAWNGRMEGQNAPIDTYVYHLLIVDQWNIPHLLSGNLTLLR